MFKSSWVKSKLATAPEQKQSREAQESRCSTDKFRLQNAQMRTAGRCLLCHTLQLGKMIVGQHKLLLQYTHAEVLATSATSTKYDTNADRPICQPNPP
jgi:hypothetical protein